MTYEYFKKNNDISKSYFPSLGRLESVDFKNNTCVMNIDGNSTKMYIHDLVNDIINNGMGALSNPSKLKGWSGFDK